MSLSWAGRRQALQTERDRRGAPIGRRGGEPGANGETVRRLGAASCGAIGEQFGAPRRVGFGPRKRARLITSRPSCGRRPLFRRGAIPAIPRQASVRPSSGHSTSTPRPRGHASHQSHVGRWNVPSLGSRIGVGNFSDGSRSLCMAGPLVVAEIAPRLMQCRKLGAVGLHRNN
jgi:hypothetical protein